MIGTKCPYQFCESRQVEALFYREGPESITYECRCRDCGRRFALSINTRIAREEGK